MCFVHILYQSCYIVSVVPYTAFTFILLSSIILKFHP